MSDIALDNPPKPAKKKRRPRLPEGQRKDDSRTFRVTAAEGEWLDKFVYEHQNKPIGEVIFEAMRLYAPTQGFMELAPLRREHR